MYFYQKTVEVTVGSCLNSMQLQDDCKMSYEYSKMLNYGEVKDCNVKLCDHDNCNEDAVRRTSTENCKVESDDG